MPSLFVVPDVSVTVIPGVGNGFTVMVIDVVDKQLFAFVTVTVYVVVVAGLTVILAVVAPVLQRYWTAFGAVNITLSPLHIIPSLFKTPEVSVTKIGPTGNGVTIIVCVVALEHPFESVTVTE